MADLNFPKDRTELVPPGTGSLQTGDTYTANGQTWVYDATVGAWGSGGGESSGDLFLSKVKDDTAAGQITFEKVTTHEGGVSVTGGTAGEVVNGLIHTPDGLVIVESGSEQVFLGNPANLVNVRGTCTNRALRVNSQMTGDNAFQGIRITNQVLNTAVNYQGIYIEKPGGSGTVSGDVSGVFIRNNFTDTGSTTYGINSGVGPGVGNNYNFFTSQAAPNFFAGDTYIGGNTTRNTFELWKSLLTEEQKEELEAGTLVAPANVATPGDGEFARQWWYDQQSTEDQELIDAGELEYPTHLAAATFTDTFALGDNTHVNLNASGASEFKGGVKLSGGNIASVVNGFYGRTGEAVGIFEVFGNLNRTGGPLYGHRMEILDDTISGTPTEFVSYDSMLYSALNINFSSYATSGNNLTGTVPEYKGFHCTGGGLGNVAKGTGFYSNVVIESGTERYNFYAEGTAPNYFKGDIQCSGNYRNRLPTTAQSSASAVTGRIDCNSQNVANSISFVANAPQNVTDGRVTTIGYQVDSGFGNDYTDGSRAAYGFKSNMFEASNGNTYNFYAEGNAPNYFNGGVQFDTAAGTTALADYEEGTFTPEFSNAPAGVTYNSQLGKYVKVGTIVNVYLELNYTGASGTDNPEIEMPFTGINLSGSANAGMGGSVGVYAATGSSIVGSQVVSSIKRNSNKMSIGVGSVRTQNAGGSTITYDMLPTAVLRITACYNTKA